MTGAKIECMMMCMNEKEGNNTQPFNFMSVAKTARIFKVTSATIRNWFNDGKFPNSQKLEDSLILIHVDDINAVRQSEIAKRTAEIKQLQKTI